jgi:hypothetical protein
MLIFRNSGSVSCTLEGYPGVSFVSGSTQVGASAAQMPGTLARVILSPGGVAVAQLGITEASNFGAGCGITNVDGLKVFPPNQTTSLIVSHNDQACSNTSDVTLHVGPVAVGSST